MIRHLALAVTLAVAPPALAIEPSADDRRALQQIAERMDEAWTEADVDGNTALFASDATARFGDDPIGSGRDAIRAQFRSFFAIRPPGLRHVTRIERIELLGPGRALWDAEVRVERRQDDGSWKTVTTIRNVTVAIRLSEGWRIQAVRAFPVG